MILGIERNLNILGRVNNMHFGVTQAADGLVRVLSLGHLHTRWVLNQTSKATKKHFTKLKKERENRKATTIGDAAEQGLP